jgi:hypothetical protein
MLDEWPTPVLTGQRPNVLPLSGTASITTIIVSLDRGWSGTGWQDGF